MSVVPIGIQDVYDLEVEIDHSYIAHGFVNHNSSHDPNMQNIPRDPFVLRMQVLSQFKGVPFKADETWAAFVEKQKARSGFSHMLKSATIDLRKIFIPKRGHVFIGADYSQLELRMVAHLSKDKVMCEAYNAKDADFHQQTAERLSKVSGFAIDRQEAKTLNFALQYGMYHSTLAWHLRIPPKKAKTIWESYMRLFAGRTKYIQMLYASARKSHFVRTILGRRRNVHVLGINDYENFGRRNYAQNASVSTAVSGSSSDLIKVAMLRIQKRYPKIRCVLQIHDELLYEVKESEAEKYLPLVKREMEQAMKLAVPIVADASIGKSWRAVHG